MPTQTSDASWQRAIVFLTGLTIAIVVVASLYLVQVIFIPLALAVLLTFILGPGVRFLQKRGIPRVPSVILVILLAATFLTGLGWVIGSQITALVEDIPNYEANIKKKIDFLKEFDPGTGRLQRMFHELAQDWKDKSPKPETVASNPTRAPDVEEPRQTIVVNPLGASWVATLPHYLGTALASLGGAVFVLALCVFMLLKREDLRSRFLRLAGRDHLTLTTKAVDEAFHRISRFLVMQMLLNCTFGVLLAVGLAFMGVKHAILWGVMVSVMRYVPYIGAWIVGFLLLSISIATSADWLQPIMVLALFSALELVASHVAEPLLYGRSIGVSQVALLVAAAFWAFLWGPIGLVLSGPMTVCLVVLGKYVPQLKFIDVLLGDEPALSPAVSYYQRLLAQDKEEAIDLVLAQSKTLSLEQICDSVLMPALTFAKRDRGRDELTDEDEMFVHRVSREILENLDKSREPKGAEEDEATQRPRIRMMACPGQDDADVLSLEMCRRLLDMDTWEIELISPELLTSEIVALVREKCPALLCIASVPPGGLLQARHLCKRLLAEMPDLKIVVGRWGLKDGLEQNRNDLKEVGASEVWTSFAEMRESLNIKHPEFVVRHRASRPNKSEAVLQRAL